MLVSYYNCILCNMWFFLFLFFFLKVTERGELLNFFYTKFDKSHIAGLCKELAMGEIPLLHLHLYHI